MVTRPKKDMLAEALASSRSAFILVGVFSLFVNLAMLITPLYMLQVYDRVLTSMSKDTLMMLTLLAGGLLLLNGLVDIARSRLLVRVGARMDAHLSQPLFRTVLAQKLRGLQRSASQPLRDLGTLRSFLTGAGLIALFDAPWAPIYLVIIYLFDPLLGMVACLGAVIILALAVCSEFAARAPLKISGIASRRSNDFVDSISRNADAIHAMGMAGNLEKRWLDDHEDGVAWQAVASDRVGFINSIAKVVRMGLQVAILCVGAWLAIEQVISPGVMVAASIIMGRALAPVQAAIGGWRGVIDARNAYDRLKNALQPYQEETERTKLPVPEGHLVVEDLVMRMPGLSEPVLKQVSFELMPGNALGLIGPSGAGKSTLARLMVGIWHPTYGNVSLDGANIASWSNEEIGPHLGYMPQDVELLDGTIAENIARFGELDSAKLVKAAKIADTHKLILALPDGYETRIGEGGYVLSGGQRQRIALARAVFGDPSFIVLDEPNANLDSDGEMALARALSTLKEQGCTLIVISHRPSLLASVDKLLVLRDGQVELFGDREKIMAELPRAVEPSPRRPVPGTAPSRRAEGKKNVVV